LAAKIAGCESLIILSDLSMTEQVVSLFDDGIQRYMAGEGPDTLIPIFQEVCKIEPKNGAAFSCLAWLYLLDNQPNPAYKAAQKAVKLDPSAPQGRVNLAIAMLETNQKGVRPHVEIVQQLMAGAAEAKESVAENLADGLERKPDWKSLQRVKSWLFPD
jgi:predicted Zn-dependent protease